MKLRAPRCRDARFVTSSAACHVIQSAPAPGAGSVAAAAAPLARTQATRSARLMVFMKNHSFGHGFHFVDARVPRHQDEVREIADGEDAREDDVQPFGRLQPEVAEYHE